MSAEIFTIVALLGGTLTSATGTSSSSRPLALAARALVEQDAARAQAALEGWAAGDLEDYRALYLGEALLRGLQTHAGAEREKTATRARELLRSIPESPRESLKCKPACKHPLWVRARELLAELDAPSAPERAAEILAALPADGARWIRAAALFRSVRQEDRARGVDRRLLLEKPESPEGRALASELGPSGVRERLGTTEARIERVRMLLETHENVAARGEARLLIAELEPKAEHLEAVCELRYVEGKASRKLREYRAALAALPAAVSACRRAKNEARAQASSLLEVQVRAIRGDIGGSQRVVKAMIAADASHRFADDALLVLAQLLERSGRAEDARQTYRRILDHYADGDQAGEAAWWLAFEAFRRGAITDAKDALARAERAQVADPMDRARVLYWKARLADSSEACAAFQRAALDVGLTFYSWLSHAHLVRSDPPCAAALKKALVARIARDGSTQAGLVRPDLPALTRAPAYLRARQLGEIGMSEEAALELSLLEQEVADAPGLIALGLAYHRVGAHFEAQGLLRARAGAVLAAPPSKDTRPVFEAAYSRPFAEELERAAGASKVETLLLTALVREESTFDPEIVSWAGAVGLAQLMPATAIGAHADLGLGRLDLARLRDPALNLRLGAHVLRVGLRQFGQAAPLALAAYNAGAGLVRKTLPADGNEPFDVWVESIPVRETRRYVQRVCQTWGIYRFLYDPASPFIPLPAEVQARY